MNSEYTLSLITLAKEENLVDDFYNEINSLITIFKEKEINDFFTNKFIKEKDKKEKINIVLNNINKYLLNFINIVIDDGKCDSLIEIFENYKELYYKEKNIVKGIIYGLEIDENKINLLEQAFAKKLNKKIILEFKQDIKLIGGYKVVVDNKMYDNSYKRKLNNIKEKLLEEGEIND